MSHRKIFFKGFWFREPANAEWLTACHSVNEKHSTRVSAIELTATGLQKFGAGTEKNELLGTVSRRKPIMVETYFTKSRQHTDTPVSTFTLQTTTDRKINKYILKKKKKKTPWERTDVFRFVQSFTFSLLVCMVVKFAFVWFGLVYMVCLVGSVSIFMQWLLGGAFNWAVTTRSKIRSKHMKDSERNAVY